MTEHYFSATPQTPLQPRPIQVTLAGRELTLQSSAGVFSHDGLDRGTAVLLRALGDPPPTGNLLDIGCGWGAISLDAALQAEDLRVWGIDVNEHALALSKLNAKSLGLANVTVGHAAEIPAEIEFAEIRSNPPIRVGKEVLHELMRTWLPRLRVGGVAYLVVAKQLGAPSFEKWLAAEFADSHTVARFARDKGFHVIAVTRTV